jgi:hypothetical protein
MALNTGALKADYGSTVNHIVGLSSLTTGSFSGSGDIDNAFSNSDGYSWCDIVVTLTKGAAGTAGLGIRLYRRDLNIVSTSDSPEPDANFKWKDVGFLMTDSSTAEQFLELNEVRIPTGHACEFYIENLTGQTISDVDLDIKPFTWNVQA